MPCRPPGPSCVPVCPAWPLPPCYPPARLRVALQYMQAALALLRHAPQLEAAQRPMMVREAARAEQLVAAAGPAAAVGGALTLPLG